MSKKRNRKTTAPLQVKLCEEDIKRLTTAICSSEKSVSQHTGTDFPAENQETTPVGRWQTFWSKRIKNAARYKTICDENRTNPNWVIRVAQSVRASITSWFAFAGSPTRLLRYKNSSILASKFLVSSVCSFTSFLSQLFSVLLTIQTICDFRIKEVSLVNAISTLLFACLIWTLGRLLAAVSLDIEESEDPTIIFGMTSSVIALLTLAVAIVSRKPSQ